MEKTPNFHNIAGERREVRKSLAEAEENDLPESIISGLSREKANLDAAAAAFSIPEPKWKGGLKRAKEQLRGDKKLSQESMWLDNESLQKELGPFYEEIRTTEKRVADLRDFEMRRLREMQSNPHAKKANENLLKTIQKEKMGFEKTLHSLEKKDPQVFRAAKLLRYKQGLHEEGHIAPTPLVENNLKKIGTRMITGKPMFLHGPTGTGKTSLARFAARRFTGQDAEMVYCNPQTRESNIWGKTGIKPTGSGGIQTVDIFGPLARAIKEGKIAIFDEFTALPREQQVFIKGIFNAKVGDIVNIVGNGRVEVAPGFQMVFTANLKSEKNPERQELPPEIAREFEQNNLEVDYTPKEEAYDIMLARLMNSDGSANMSWYDLNTTLPKLCEAIEEIQIAYTDKERESLAKLTGTLDASGKRQGLKKFVMTQGTIEAVLESWAVEKRKGEEASFIEFLDERLATGLTFKEYPEADRVLAAKILASKGFLRTKTAEDLSLPKNVFDFDAAKKSRGDKKAIETLRADSGKEVHLSVKELANLDPFGLRRRSAAEAAEQFLTPEGAGDAFSNTMDKRMARILGKERQTGDAIISAEYLYLNPKTGAEERREMITLDVEKSLDRYIALYQETGVGIPADFREQVEDIWARNSDEIEKAIKEKGFDDMIIAPANIPLDELKEKMKMKNGYFTGSNFDAGGGFAGAKSTGVDTPRVILIHRSQNLKDRPELQATLGIKAEKVRQDEALSLEDYLYFQRIYFKETGKHLDEDGWTWLVRTKSGTRFVGGGWSRDFHRLDVSANDADYSSPSLGCRPSRYFI